MKWDFVLKVMYPHKDKKTHCFHKMTVCNNQDFDVTFLVLFDFVGWKTPGVNSKL